MIHLKGVFYINCEKKGAVGFLRFCWFIAYSGDIDMAKSWTEHGLHALVKGKRTEKRRAAAAKVLPFGYTDL